MFDLVYFLQLLGKKWPSALAILFLIGLCFWLLTGNGRYGLRVLAVAISLAFVLYIGKALYTEYLLLALGNEVDLKAERAFSTIKGKLSDQDLIYLLSTGGRGNNQQFYIALIGAERNLKVPNAKDISRPGFFKTNSYTSFANRLQYPLTYEELLRKYQETFGRVQPKG